MTIIYSHKKLADRNHADFYPTPIELCLASVKLVPNLSTPFTALDVGAGDGVWGKALKSLYNNIHLTGIDIREDAMFDWELFNNSIRGNILVHAYDSDMRGDFMEHDRKYDLIFGNIPFRHATEFIQHSLDLLTDNGIILYLLRSAISESKKRYDLFYNNGHKPIYEYQSVRRISFTGNKKSDNTAYSIFIWEKKKDFQRETVKRWLDWEYEK